MKSKEAGKRKKIVMSLMKIWELTTKAQKGNKNAMPVLIRSGCVLAGQLNSSQVLVKNISYEEYLKTNHHI